MVEFIDEGIAVALDVKSKTSEGPPGPPKTPNRAVPMGGGGTAPHLGTHPCDVSAIGVGIWVREGALPSPVVLWAAAPKCDPMGIGDPIAPLNPPPPPPPTTHTPPGGGGFQACG